MRDINRPSGNNLGGVIRFNFIDVNDVLSIAETIDGCVNEVVKLKDGGQWYAGYGTQNTIGYKEPPEPNPNGPIYKKSFVAMCPQDSSDNKDLFREMRNKRFIVDLTTSNGIRLLAGTLEEPLQFTAILDTKIQVPELAGYSIAFYGDGSLPTPVYSV